MEGVEPLKVVYMTEPQAETMKGQATSSGGTHSNPYENPDFPPGHAAFNPFAESTNAERSSAAAEVSSSAHGDTDRIPRAMYPKRCDDLKMYVQDGAMELVEVTDADTSRTQMLEDQLSMHEDNPGHTMLD